MAITLGNFTTSVHPRITGNMTLPAYTLMEGRNRILGLVYALLPNSAVVPSTPVFNGTSMIPLIQETGQVTFYTYVYYLLEEDLPAGGDYTTTIAYPGSRWAGVVGMFCANGVVQEEPYAYGSSDTGNGNYRSPVTLTSITNGSLLFFTGTLNGHTDSFTPDANYTEQWDDAVSYTGSEVGLITSTGITRAITSDDDYTLGATSVTAGFHIGAALAIAAIKNNFSAQINIV